VDLLAGWTALHNAAIGGHTWIVRTLLKEGANAVAQTTGTLVAV